MTERKTRERGFQVKKTGLELIEQRMREQNIDSYEQLADQAQLSVDTVKRIFNPKWGKNPQKNTVQAIARVLNLDPSDLVEGWHKVPQPKKSVPPQDIDWLRVCREMWAKQREDQRIRRKVTERGFEVNVYVGLGLVQRVQQQRRQGEMDRDEILALTDTEAIAHTYEHDRFLDRVIGQKPRGQNRHIAIIGEPGAGKSTLLAAIANHLTKDESKIMPICLSLAGLQGKTIKDYLLDIWLSEAIKLAYPEIVVVEDSHKISFQQWLRQSQVWLLLDGLDEIGDRAPAQVQNDIKNELTDWLGYVRVALTCRLNVWDASLNNLLTGFDTYKTDKFKPDDIKKFIEDWFEQAKKPEAGKILQNKLDQSKYTNLRGLVTNPLRLSLLCQVFYRNSNLELPETKAGLYKIFVRNFYDWKAEQNPILDSEQEKLNLALGKVALAGLDNQYNFKRFRLPKESARKVMTDELFELAENIGWLNIVDRDANDEAVYAFWHPTFQEYFAACAIDDWQFFLKHGLIIFNPQNNDYSYRIFEPQWKEVFLFWMGRGDVEDEHKERFIEALVSFNDGCYGNLYWYRAYFLAAVEISEFKTCSLADAIVKQIVQWCFGDYNEEQQKRRTFLDPIKENARETLPQTDRKRAIRELCQILKHPQCSKSTRGQAFESLGEIGQGDEMAIAALVKFLDPTEDEDTHRKAAENLWKIDPGNQMAIAALVKVIEDTDNEDTHRQAIYCLGKIGQGNQMAIAALVKVIEDTEDEDALIEAAESLGQIDPGNETAIAALIKILETIEYEDTRRWTANTLKKIGQGNQTAINDLVRILETTKDEDVRMLVAETLWEIDPGNQMAIDVLVKFLDPTEDEDVRMLVAETLWEIDPGNQMAIDALVEVLTTTGDEFTRIQAAFSLGEINPGNQTAIDELVKILTTTKKESTRKRAADTLWEINPGNQRAIAELVKILETPGDEFTRIQAAFSLGEINPGNQTAIDELVKILETPGDEFTRIQAAFSLGEINPGNQTAIAELVRILITTEDKFTRGKAAKCLEQIITTNENRKYVVTALQPYLNREIAENNFHLWINCYKILWKIAQDLPYPDFYRAWHGETSTLGQTLESQINSSLQLQPTATTYPLCLDIKYLCDETDHGEIAQELANQIFEQIAPNERIPTIKGKSDLKRELANLTIYLQVEKIALMFDLRGLEINPDFKQSAFYQIALWLAKHPKIFIAWISDRIANHPLNIDPPMRGFISEQDNLLDVLQNWLNDV